MACYRVLGSAADLRGSSRHAGTLRRLERLGAIDFSYAREAVEAQNTLEAVLASGQKIQFDSAVKLTMRRPNKLRAEGSGDIVSQIFYYDGKTFAPTAPPTSITPQLRRHPRSTRRSKSAHNSLDVYAPASYLLYKDAFTRPNQDVTSGFVVGKAAIGGVKCDQLAFRGPEVDWQIWIAEGDKSVGSTTSTAAATSTAQRFRGTT